MPWNLLRPRSTGWWDITAQMAGVTSGQLLVEREGDTVWLDFQDLDARQISGSWAQWNGLLGIGLRPPRMTDLAIIDRSSDGHSSTIRVSTTGQIVVYRHNQGGGSLSLLRGLVAFRTTQTMITTVPGGVKL